MCGICGIFHFERERPVDTGVLRRMAGTMSYRGPDDEGFYISPGIGLGHRRLSIIDLSTGKQPLSNETETIWIVFNGEIYNYQELRRELLDRGHVFRTDSDTEVIVHLYEDYGPGALNKLRGMFAFAIWDDTKRALFLARDRVGIKPLYYAQTNSTLLFASEMKAILSYPDVPRELNPQVIDRALSFRYTPGAETLLRGINKLPPGHYLLARDGQITVQQYWDLQFVPRVQNGHNVADELTGLLRDTVREHLISDVPVGVLLSGGVDSTAILSFASESSTNRIKTFTIGFDGPGSIDERPFAQLAAKAAGSEHFETTITPRDFRDFWPRYVWHMEEPVCEPPAVALYYVSKLASEHVKVLLSGEGGDEAFGGYPEYRNFPMFERMKSFLGPLNGSVGGAMGWAGRLSHSHRLDKYAGLMTTPLQSYYLGRTALPTNFADLDSLYRPEFRASIDRSDSTAIPRQYFQNVANQELLNQMLYVDTKTWLPDDLLLKADKITMANSVELRVPLLDHRVLEFAASLPTAEKVHGWTTKCLLRRVLGGKVPGPILKRKKAGFPVPYGSWLRNELKEMVSDVLLSQSARQRPYFQPQAIEKLLQDNASNGEHSKQLFSLVTLELWHRTFLDCAS